MLSEQGSILPIVRWIDFFLGPWLLVYQSIEISNQIKNFEMKILCNSVLYNFIYPKFGISPIDSIWLEISIDWYTKGQGPKKKCINFSRGRLNPFFAHIARNEGSFTP